MIIMTSNILDENDLDFDASVSSLNSDSEKVDSSLIKRILSEMKSEFNRGASENPEEGENENETEDYGNALKMDNLQGNRENIKELESEPANDDNDLCNEENITEIAEGNCKNAPIIINKTIFHTEEEGDEHKPRLILTLRTSEEDREMGSRLSRRISVCQTTSDIANTSFSSVSDSSVTEKPEFEDKGSMWESINRRSLRSSTRILDRDNENTGMKRSSRRFSKEQCRESVLQSAIARKEKSFSSLNQFEERSSRRGARSPRQSSNEQKINRPVTRSKSPKSLVLDKSLTLDSNSSEVVLKQGDLCDINSLLSVKTESDFSLSLSKLKSDDLSDNSNDTMNINSASTNSQTSEPPMDIKPLKTNKMYTKTGKRRVKYFKGLKYSLTTGGSVVRKRALNVGKRTKKKNQDPTSSLNINSEDINPNNFDNENHKNGNQIIESSGRLEEKDSVSNENTNKKESKEEDYQESDNTTEMLVNVKEEPLSESPPLGDICETVRSKRKRQSDGDDSDAEKRCCVDVPSPCQGDVEAEPNKPEASAISIGVGTAGVCLCNKRDVIYAKTSSCHSELYCQAVDSLDGRLIGCCNTINKDDARLLRPSARVPFLVLCDVHNDRLQRHNCCPGCGIFCTQGKFVQCWAYHQYHRECQLEVEGRQVCPHCGSDDAYDVNISLGAHKYPVFFPLQKPTKKTPSAKMTFTYKTEQSEDDKVKETDLTAPLMPATSLVLPSGLQISSLGLPAPLDKDKLERLLHVACSPDSFSMQRFTLRHMYQAAKSGEAEKMVLMLATGLNPNHVFREWGMGSALHAACSGGHLAVVHLLLQAGANTDVLDRDQNTPLMLACSNGHNEVVKYLVKAGASVTFKGGDGMTALHLAAKSGNVEACHYLIANPNTPRNFIDSVDDGRWTPLVWAAEHKHIDVVRFLLQKRADPLVRDAEQNIALHWAALSGCCDISEALLNYGSDVNSTNAHADTPLHIAARQNAYKCVILLLARGARVDMHNRAGFTPLECVTGAPNDTYTAIKLNVELRNLTLNVQQRTHKILTNDITRGYEANPVQCVNSVDDETEPQDFVYITENCFTSNISIDRTITSLQSCKCRDMCVSGGCMCGKISIRCWYDDEGKLLPEFNFADPPMLFECNQACTCNRLTCKNRVVQHGLTARFQLFRTKGNKGWGVRTLRIIPKGAYVCEYIGEIISDCEADTREDDSYLFDLDNRDGETYCIDARKYGNIARFINHSCMPNLLPVRVFIDHQDLHFPRIAFFANQDIKANEELGFDYGEKFWTIKSKLFTCTCGAEKCKYSETTIEKTLAAYAKKLQQEDNH